MDNSITTSNILSIIAILVALFGGGLFAFFVKRTFSKIDKEIKEIKDKKWVSVDHCKLREEQIEYVDDSLESIKITINQLDKDLIRIQETTKNINEKVEKLSAVETKLYRDFLEKKDFIPEISKISDQIEKIYNKFEGLWRK